MVLSLLSEGSRSRPAGTAGKTSFETVKLILSTGWMEQVEPAVRSQIRFTVNSYERSFLTSE